MQTISPVSSARSVAGATLSGRKTVFEVHIPHLEDSGNGAGPPASLISSPVRGLHGSSEVAMPHSPVARVSSSNSRTSHHLRAEASPVGSAPPSRVVSNRYSFTTEVDGLLSNTLSGPGGANTSSTANPLTKPTLSPSSIRCCSQDQWMPDAHVVNCMAPDCSTSFSLFNRKYHCKICGRVFCSSCCSYAVSIPSAGVAPSTRSAAAAAHTANGAALPNASLAGAAAMNSLAAALSSAPGSSSFSSFGSLSGDTAVALPGTATSASAAAAPTFGTFRVCNSCRYELHLVVSTRQENGERRRKSRGELKMLQWALVVNILSFLPFPSLLETALVSSDFYFMTRDNVIWYGYNMMRWLKDAEQTQTQLSLASSAASKTARSNFGFRGGKRGPASSFEAAAVLQDATALTESEAAKRVISLHARYNYTQFLDFTRRQEMSRCEGLSSFSVGSRILLSSPVKVALIGPSGIGKTASVRGFLGSDRPANGAARAPPTTAPTVGFVHSTKTVRLVGDLSTEVTLHIYDISGAPRYEALRRFMCAQCHAIGLCYDPASKVTLVEAADIMMGIEAALGPQPVVVCGLLRDDTATPAAAASTLANPNATPHNGVGGSGGGLAVSEDDAIAITVRTAGSLQCPIGQCEPFYKKLLQCLLDRLAMATMVGNTTVADISGEVTDAAGLAPSAFRRSAMSRAAGPNSAFRRPQASKVTAQELLNLTMQPCALDILLDPK